MSESISDRLLDLVHGYYHGDSMETFREPIATLLAAHEAISRHIELIAKLRSLIEEKLREGRCGIEWGERAEALLETIEVAQ